jgi:hypothetical protein
MMLFLDIHKKLETGISTVKNIRRIDENTPKSRIPER